MPGAFWNFSQPIEDNVDETFTGTKGGLAAKLYGPDLDVLEQKGEEIKEVMSQIPGVHDLGASTRYGPAKSQYHRRPSSGSAVWHQCGGCTGRHPNGRRRLSPSARSCRERPSTT